MSKRQPSRSELMNIIEQLMAENAQLRERVEQLEVDLELARNDPSGPKPPPWIKPNSPERKGEKRPRKKRAEGYARKRSTASSQIVHAVERCPECECVLQGGTVKRRREVIEIVLSPAEVTEHIVVERVCPLCSKRCVPKLGVKDGIVGRHRFGPKLLALIATLHEVGRLPVRRIQGHLESVFGLRISVGAIEYALHTVATKGTAAVEAILQQTRESAVVHADETGWREDGQNRYVWVLATPNTRYFEIGRRNNEQIDSMLGESFSGIVVSDFYKVYDHLLGEHQRCWAHLLRDVRELVGRYPKNRSLARWAHSLKLLYRSARASPTRSLAERRAIRKRLERIATRICQPFIDSDAPQRTLCERILRYVHELFTFVVNRQVSPTNNEAERSLRPLVIARKVWGGTRSKQGSIDAMRRATLMDTWRVRGLNPFLEVQKLLLSPQI